MSSGAHFTSFSTYRKLFHWGKASRASKEQVLKSKKRGTSTPLPLYSFDLFDREVGARNSWRTLRCIFFIIISLMGWDWVHLVLRLYCTSPRW
jgi:hypothetical protein